MKIIAVFAALLVAAVSNAQPKPQATTTSPTLVAANPTLTWTDCATRPSHMNVTSFSASPVPFCANRPLQLIATGNLADPIVEGAMVELIGRWSNRMVLRERYDLCKILADAGTPCPTAANLDSLTINGFLRPSTPINFPINITAEATNGDGNLIFCQAAKQVTAVNCDPPTTTTPRPIPTPVAGDWTTCDGPQDLKLSSFTASPKAWCEGMNVCFDFTGTIQKEITSYLYMTLSTGYSKPTDLKTVFGSWGVIDLQKQGFPYIIPAGPMSFKFCGPLNQYTPDSASAWRLGLSYLPDRGSTFTDILCLKTTNVFEIPKCP